ncbi:dTDP-4-dehydrorhamnose reductase [Thermoanaerobacter uzonensis]|uniref:dTDP-4-dehydrorhamnose reductase n=1 Tax=Thermoanaerobacter uzonensis TaxID=447593 RepID=UPI003D769240
MKILITGKTGQLGHDLYELLKDKEEVIAVGREEFDITDINSTQKFIKEYLPDIIVHCAAYTKVDDCEKNKDLAYEVNAIGTGNIASICSDIGAKMVYISTDYVFDGTKNTPYLEFDTPNPLNVYGKSKLAGEEIVKEILDKHYIVRTSWLYGINGNNFVKTMLRLSKERSIIKVVNDQHGIPTFTRDLAEGLYFLIKTDAYGTYHITNSGETTWYEFAKKIFEISKINVMVEPITTEEYNAPALRPKYSVLDNYILKLRFNYEMRNWEEGLKTYLELLI